MALSASVLSALIKSNFEASFTVDDATELEKMTDAIAQGIVDHFTAAATVSSAGATGAGPAGGPLPIIALPGVIV